MSINTKLRKKLLRMGESDQLLRQEQAILFKQLNKNDAEKNDLTYNSKITKLSTKLLNLDRKHAEKMKKIVKQFGWPGKSLVGIDGAYAAWLLIQHAVHDRPFQKRCLKLLTEAVNKNEADKKNLAYLTDRILVFEGKEQIYGTQFKGNRFGKQKPFPIYKSRGLNKRRRDVGLEPFKLYKKKMGVD